MSQFVDTCTYLAWYYVIVRKREKGKTMTNFTDTLKTWELKVWNSNNVWQKARIAYRHEAMNELSTDELNHVIDTLKDANFIADMSDDWKVTCAEKRENNAIATAAQELLAA